MDAVNDGLWDLFSHQYTLYSVTPLALYQLLRRTTPAEREQIPDVARFIEICGSQGTAAICLSNDEIEANKRGLLPIYSIEEILQHYA